jgi:aminoglycoside 6'-N-acetyltransferase
MINMKNKKIKFKKMKSEDMALWEQWITIPHVKDAWFIEGYEPADYMAKKLAGNGYDFPFIIYIDDLPVGYIQTCDLYAYRTLCPKPKGVFCHEEKGTFCLDLFIAEQCYLGKGFGTKIVRSFVQKLKEDFHAKSVLIDPSSDNAGAIRCYEKAGFKRIRIDHDGICEVVVMEWQEPK